MTKEVYNPKTHKEEQENLGSKKETKTKAPLPEKTKSYKINKYGFLHVDKDLAKYLGIELGKDKADVPVSVERIEGGFTVRIVKA